MRDENLFGAEGEPTLGDILNREESQKRAEAILGLVEKPQRSRSQEPLEEESTEVIEETVEEIEVLDESQNTSGTDPPRPQNEFLDDMVKVNALTREVQNLETAKRDIEHRFSDACEEARTWKARFEE